MVFQSAMDALNPVVTIGEQITDTLRAHTAVGGGEARERAAELLGMVGIPRGTLDAFAHQLSGGMRQRVCIAIALALNPSLVILDEPTTALDVIVEREILEQMRELQARLGFSVLFITHDLGRMLQFSDRVAIFYAARLVEIGPAAGDGHRPEAPVHAGTAPCVSLAAGRAGRSRGHPGRAAQPRTSARWLPVPPALPAGDGALPDRGPRPGDARPGTHRGLLRREVAPLAKARRPSRSSAAGAVSSGRPCRPRTTSRSAGRSAPPTRCRSDRP